MPTSPVQPDIKPATERHRYRSFHKGAVLVISSEQELHPHDLLYILERTKLKLMQQLEPDDD